MPAAYAIESQQHAVTVCATGTTVKVFDSFPCKLAYAIRCLLQTTLGPEILHVVLPRASEVLPLALRYDNVAKFLWLFCKVAAPLIIFAQVATMFGSYQTVFQWLVRFAGICALAYSLSLLAMFFCLYCPLMWIVKSDVAMTLRVEDAGDGLNDFLKVEFGTQHDRARIDWTEHILAMRLRVEHNITLMIYTDAWLAKNLSIDRLITELSLCLFLLLQLVACGFTEEDLSTSTHLVATLMRAFVLAIFPRILQRVATAAGVAIWVLLNVAFCCMPEIMRAKAAKKLEKYVHEQAVAHNPDPNGLVVQAEVIGSQSGGMEPHQSAFESTQEISHEGGTATVASESQ